MACYERALHENPRNALAWQNLGNVYLGLQRADDALDCYGKAVSLDRRRAIAWRGMGEVLSSRGQYREALSCLDRAIELIPSDQHAQQLRATLILEFGNS